MTPADIDPETLSSGTHTVEASNFIEIELAPPPFGPGIIVALFGPALCTGNQQQVLAMYPPGAVTQDGPSIKDASADGWRLVVLSYERGQGANDAVRRRELLSGPVEDVEPLPLVDVMRWISNATAEILSWTADVVAKQARVRMLLGTVDDRLQLARDLATYYDFGAIDQRSVESLSQDENLVAHLAATEPRWSREHIATLIEQLGFTVHDARLRDEPAASPAPTGMTSRARLLPPRLTAAARRLHSPCH